MYLGKVLITLSKHLKLQIQIKLKTINWCLFQIDDEKLFKKYKAIWTEDLNNIELNVLSVYDDRCIKTKIRTYGDKVCTNFRGLNVQVCLDNCTNKIANKKISDYLDENLFED